MKTLIKVLAGLILAGFACACQGLFSETNGAITIAFLNHSITASKSDNSLLCTDDFILSITNSEGTIIYDGVFGSSPESIDVPPGSYTVTAVSELFHEPAFDIAQFGDSQVVVVSSGQTVAVTLCCKQINSGIRLLTDSKFRSIFPDGSLFINAADARLEYPYGEIRTAYFKPGVVSVSLMERGEEQTLFSRTLEAQQILDISISASQKSTSKGIEIQVDTTRERLSADYIYGESGGNDISDAYNITDALKHIGEKGVWVLGYIVGIATSTGRFSFEMPFDKSTNILLGVRSTTINKDYCLSVELKAGNIRDNLNLLENSSVKGRAIYIKGDLVSSYYGIPGLKNITEYQFR